MTAASEDPSTTISTVVGSSSPLVLSLRNRVQDVASFMELDGKELRQMVGNGLFVVCSGAALYLLQRSCCHLWDLAKCRFTLRVVFDSRERPFKWILEWLADHQAMKNAHSLAVTTRLERYGVSEDKETAEQHLLFSPGAGKHRFTFMGKWIFLERTEASADPSGGRGLGSEQIILTLFGNNEESRKVVKLLVQEALTHCMHKTKSKTVIYTGDQHGIWNVSVVRPTRPMSAVILADHLAEKLVADAKSFLKSEEWYAQRGIPYRRAYLLHGKPGCGKTSFVTALAGELGVNIYVINLASKALNDELLMELMRDVPYKNIILFEDIDSAFVPLSDDEDSYLEHFSPLHPKRSGLKATSKLSSDSLVNEVSFSGLLNALDGVAAQEGRIVFLTTNHFERLSESLIRPGRVDVCVQFDLATAAQIRRMFVQFYKDMTPQTFSGEFSSSSPLAEGDGEEEGRERSPSVAEALCEDLSVSANELEEMRKLQRRFDKEGLAKQFDEETLQKLAEEFTRDVEDRAVSLARVQGYLMHYKKEPREAVANVHALFGCSSNNSSAPSSPSSSMVLH
ncbi:Mitochondrial chaperone BCS1 [Balamuthia mandrillaris]